MAASRVEEGSVADERIAARTGGYWSGMGAEARGGHDTPQPIPTAEWLSRLAPGAAAVIAVGTCATWGGIPAAEGNPTGAMGTAALATSASVRTARAKGTW